MQRPVWIRLNQRIQLSASGQWPNPSLANGHGWLTRTSVGGGSATAQASTTALQDSPGVFPTVTLMRLPRDGIVIFASGWLAQSPPPPLSPRCPRPGHSRISCRSSATTGAGRDSPPETCRSSSFKLAETSICSTFASFSAPNIRAGSKSRAHRENSTHSPGVKLSTGNTRLAEAAACVLHHVSLADALELCRPYLGEPERLRTGRGPAGSRD